MARVRSKSSSSSTALGTGEQSVERFAVVIDHPRTQWGQGVALLAGPFGHHRQPRDRGDLQRRLFDDVRLTIHQPDQVLAHRPREFVAIGLGQQTLEGSGDQVGGTAKVPVEGCAGNPGQAGDRLDGDSLHSPSAQQHRRGVE